MHLFIPTLHAIVQTIFGTRLMKTALARIEADLGPGHYEIMRTLKEAGTLHVSGIGGRLRIPKPGMTHLIDKLVRLGMVVRRTDASDRRTINIRLTKKGRAILGEQERLLKDTIKTTLSHLTDRELAELSVSLRRIRNVFSKLP